MINNNWEIIIQVGAEGGSISLLGKIEKCDWIFMLETNETALKYLFDDEDLGGDLVSKSNVEYSWEGALKLIDQYPHWPGLHPVLVHPDFSESTIEAISERVRSDPENKIIGRVNWAQWLRVLSEASTKSAKTTYPILSRNSQIVGNIGMYYACYHLSKLGWNVMPTARNARGVDIIAYDQSAENYLGIQVKTLSRRNPVPLGRHLDNVIGDFWVVITLVDDNPVAYVLLPEEVRDLAHRGEREGRVSYWLQPRSYDQKEFQEAWHRMENWNF